MTVNELLTCVFLVLIGLCSTRSLGHDVQCSDDKNLSISKSTYSYRDYMMNEDSNNNNNNNNTKLICYFKLSNNFGILLLEHLCTHINVGFFEINIQNSSLYVPEGKLEILKNIVSLKEKRKELKVIIAIGGANAKGFGPVVKTHATRRKFIKSVMSFMKKFKLDGIDLDWEWPALSGHAKEKIKFLQLLYEFRQEFMNHKQLFILSVDVSPSKTISELSYNIHYMAEYVTYVNIMCYDYHFYTKWYPFTGHNAPLYSSPSEFEFQLNVNQSIYYWILNSMPKEKIVLGVPTYGHTFRLYNNKKFGIHALSNGPGTIGKNGFISYSDICTFVKQRDVTKKWDDFSKVPYAYKFPDWISYDNEQSLTFKVIYAQEMKLAGVMIFSVNDDDYMGKCSENGSPFPLTRKIRKVLFNDV